MTKRRTQITRAFTRHMFKGNTKAVLQLLTDQDHVGVLSFNDPVKLSNFECSVCDALSKHPSAQPLHSECLLSAVGTPAVHPAVFDALDGSVVHAAALGRVGAAGPSGIDAREWQRLRSV